MGTHQKDLKKTAARLFHGHCVSTTANHAQSNVLQHVSSRERRGFCWNPSVGRAFQVHRIVEICYAETLRCSVVPRSSFAFIRAAFARCEMSALDAAYQRIRLDRIAHGALERQRARIESRSAQARATHQRISS